MFQGSFMKVYRKVKGVSRKLKGCFKKVSRVFKDVSGKCQGYVKNVSRVFQVKFKGAFSSFKDI